MRPINRELDMSNIIVCCGRKQTRKRYSSETSKSNILINLFVYYYSCDTCGNGDFWCILCDQLYGKPFMICDHPNIFGKNGKMSIWNHLSRKHIKGCDIFRDGYTIRPIRYNGAESTIIAEEMAKIHCSGLINKHCQLLFINQVSIYENIKIIIEAANDIIIDYQVRELLLWGSIDVTYSSDFYDWFTKFMENCNYKCARCGMIYEDGMPALEVIAEHIYDCVTFAQDTKDVPMIRKIIASTPTQKVLK